MLQEILELCMSLKIEFINISDTCIFGLNSTAMIINNKLTNASLNVDVCQVKVDTLLSFIKNKDYTLQTKEHKILAKAGRSRANIDTLPISDIIVPNMCFSIATKIPDIFQKSLSICDKNDSRVYLLGTGCVDGYVAISNGMLIVFDNSDRCFENIIPTAALALAFKHKGVILINSSFTHCSVTCDNDTSVTFGMITGSFPAFNRALPQTINYKYSLNSRDLKDSLQRGFSFTNRDGVVEILFSKNEVVLKIGSYTDTIDCTGETGELKLMFKIESLLKLAGIFEELTFEVEAPDRPVLINKKSLLVTARL